MLPVNQTLLALPPSGIRKFFDIVSTMQDVISLSVGEPDFDTPWHIRESAITALENGVTHYTGNRGRPDLLAAISGYIAGRFGVTYDARTEIVVTNGGSEGCDIALRALLNAGDEVVIPSPSYVMYAPLTALAGGVPVPVPLGARDGWKMTADMLERAMTPHTKAVILNYPGNPTGVTYTRRELLPLAKVIAKHDLYVLSDEIYAEMLYDGKHTTFASLPGMHERTVTLSGFSKAWAMTGLRLGYLAGPADVIGLCVKVHQYAALCASSVAQAAGIEALENGAAEVAKMREEYKLRRDYCVRALAKMRLPLVTPEGALYLFPSVWRTKMTGEEFALGLLKEQKIAVVPGTAFAPECTDHIRISFASSLPNLMEAMRRMAHFVK